MKQKRFFLMMIVCLSLSGLLIVGAVIGGNMLFKQQAKKLSDLKVQSRVVEEQETSLVQAKKDIEKYSELDKIAKSIVPQDKDQAKTVREISNIADSAGITLKAITFPTSTLGQTTTPAAPAAAGTAPAKSKTPPITQVVAIDGIPGVYALPITITSPDDKPIPYRKFIDFLGKLEANRRTAHVEKIAVSPTKDGSGIVFQLTLNAYVKP